MGGRWLYGACSAGPAAVVALWYALVIARVLPGCKSPLREVHSSIWRFWVAGGDDGDITPGCGDTIDGDGVITVVITDGTVAIAGVTDAIGCICVAGSTYLTART